MELPNLPVPLSGFIPHLGEQSRSGILEENALEPFKVYESRLREVFAQEPTNDAISDPHVNTVPVFAGHERHLKAKARHLDNESPTESEKYILPLHSSFYNEDGSPATVRSLKEFKNNFRLFSESSLVDMDWSNVVAAGSSVTTCLLPLPEEHGSSKKAQREYYHDKLAPASDVDLFIYGLGEQEAIEKIKQIEKCITESILEETTVIRTKNALTIASKYPTRHVQIVLRLYKSVSEILTGFDVDCACTAFDGSQVWASPRALSAFVTQANVIDITRRSPSYENRLAKYARRGFEVHWPNLDRSKIDPTIFERSFSHVVGLARLLIIEKLPTSYARETYSGERRAERDRPASLAEKFYNNSFGNLKEQQPEDIAEWVEDEDVSSYHTFTIPYGPKYTARKIERLLYKKDLLLNAEWNEKKDRKVDLHRHPAFFGAVQHVVDDCCGFCPSPTTEEEVAIAAEESKKFVSGKIEFMKDDPGRQAIGSFSPITDSDWTAMAYISDTARLCQAIVGEDIESVEKCCSKEDFDIDQRDYTGRTPLHLAITCSTPEIVQCLINHGARIVARVASGFTPLHLAAARGSAEMVRSILQKSEGNKAEYLEKADNDNGKRSKPSATNQVSTAEDSHESDDMSIVSSNSDSPGYATTEGSMVNINALSLENVESEGSKSEGSNEDLDEPNFYDHADILSWDSPVSPLHLAILNGHFDVIETLATDFGADLLRPVVLKANRYSPARAILSPTLTLHQPLEISTKLLRSLLDCGASSTQADTSHVTAFHSIVAAGEPELLDVLFEIDGPAARLAIDHPAISTSYIRGAQLPLSTTIKYRGLHMITKLLGYGAGLSASSERLRNFCARQFQNNMNLEQTIVQPLVVAAQFAKPAVIRNLLLDANADLNAMTPVAHAIVQDKGPSWFQPNSKGETVLDILSSRIKTWENIKFKNMDEDATIPKLETDSFYLDGLTEGTYQHWAAQNEICAAKAAIELMKSEHESNLEWGAKDQREDSKMKERRQRKVHDLEEVKNLLLQKGAKTFNELHPELGGESDSGAVHHQTPKAEEPVVTECPNFSVSQRFRDPDTGDVDPSQYLQLFEAAWDGDIQKVKNLTLGSWGPNNKYSPLRVSVKDRSELSPFAIAVVRGHLELAKFILEIADAQYLPKSSEPKRRRYEIVIDADSDSDDESNAGASNEEHGIGVRFDLVDEQHTIDDIRDIANTIKSTVSPSAILHHRHSNTSSFLGEAKMEFKTALKSGVSKANSKSLSYACYPPTPVRKDLSSWQKYINNLPLEQYSNAPSLFIYAIKSNDLAAVKFLIEQEEKYAPSIFDEDYPEKKQEFVTLNNSYFDLAMSLGQTEIMGHLIAKTGAEFPFSALMKNAGVKIEKKPRYYQGLSVYGKKRQDWAASEALSFGRNFYHAEKTDNLLLRAIMTKNLDSIQWFLSDQPEIKYKEFAFTYKNDERLKLLSETQGGFQDVLSSWLGSRRHLALHCAVIAPPNAQTGNSHVELVLQHVGAFLNAKNSAGLTPLLLAFSLRRIMAAKLLIKAGADSTARDTSGRNLLHLILVGDVSGSLTLSNLFKALCDILDPELIKQLAIQRTYPATRDMGWGLKTPLAHWIQRSTNCSVDMLRMILKATGGKDLYIMDATGNYPIHQMVRRMEVEPAQVMLEFDPTLAQIENATGVTPLELSETKLQRSQLLSSSELSSKILYHKTFSGWSSMCSDYISQLDRDSEPESTDERDLSPFSTLDTTERRMWELLRNTVSENPSKRKLASLHDANQVIKRLGTKRWKRPGQGWDSDDDDDDERDESLQLDYRGNDSSFEVDPFREEEEERNRRREKRRFSLCA